MSIDWEGWDERAPSSDRSTLFEVEMSCDCGPSSLRVAWTHVFTSRSVTDSFIALTEPMSSAQLARVMSRLELLSVTGDITITWAYERSDDLTSWTAAALGTGRSSAGTFDEVSSSLTAALFYRFGVYVKNTSTATRCESALVRLFLEFSSF
jgi:hypothetical protein